MPSKSCERVYAASVQWSSRQAIVDGVGERASMTQAMADRTMATVKP